MGPKPAARPSPWRTCCRRHTRSRRQERPSPTPRWSAPSSRPRVYRHRRRMPRPWPPAQPLGGAARGDGAAARHSIAGLAMAGGWRPARSQPAAAAVRGIPTTMTRRETNRDPAEIAEVVVVRRRECEICAGDAEERAEEGERAGGCGRQGPAGPARGSGRGQGSQVAGGSRCGSAPRSWRGWRAPEERLPRSRSRWVSRETCARAVSGSRGRPPRRARGRWRSARSSEGRSTR